MCCAACPITLGGSLKLTLVNGFTPAPMQKFYLLDNAATAALVTGVFSNATGSSITDAAGNFYLLNYADNAGEGTLPNDMSVTLLGPSPVVPEPSTYALALLGGLGLLGGVARQRRVARLRV